MNEQKHMGEGFFQNVIIIFAYSVIAISVVGWLVGDSEKEIGGLYGLGSQGLLYKSIFQIFISSIVMGGIRTLLLSDLIFKKMMILWRSVLLLLLTLVSVGLLAVLFRWFPIGEWEAWAGYVISVIVCFIIGSSAMIIKTKLLDKRYDKLLSDYKEKQKKESGE